jgi:hypothetical protein
MVCHTSAGCVDVQVRRFIPGMSCEGAALKMVPRGPSGQAPALFDLQFERSTRTVRVGIGDFGPVGDVEGTIDNDLRSILYILVSYFQNWIHDLGHD